MVQQTVQRAAIRRVLQEAGRPLGPTEILAAGQRVVPTLGLTTVYRTVKSLVEEGWLDVVDLPGEPSRYECSGKPAHHHFECRECHRVFDVVGPVEVGGLVPPGFVASEHVVVVYGFCDGCQGG